VYLWGFAEIDRRGATITLSAHKFCHICRIEIARGHEHAGVGGIIYCPTCWKSASTVTGAPAPPTRSAVTAKNVMTVPQGADTRKYNCGFCKAQIPFSDVNFFEGEIACTPCFEKARAGADAPMAACQKCGGNILKSSMVIFDGKRLCPECFDEARINKNQEFQMRRQALSASRVTLRQDPPKAQGKFGWIVTIISALIVAAVVVMVIYAMHQGFSESAKPVTYTLILSDGRRVELPRPDALEKLAADKKSFIIKDGVKLSHDDSVDYVQTPR
jgi:hypothetical protein